MPAMFLLTVKRKSTEARIHFKASAICYSPESKFVGACGMPAYHQQYRLYYSYYILPAGPAVNTYMAIKS